MPFTAETAAAAGRVGGLRTRAKHDPREYMAAANAAVYLRWLDEVDPERKLPEAERIRRAEAARRAHMAALTLRSLEAQRKKRQNADAADVNEREHQRVDADEDVDLAGPDEWLDRRFDASDEAVT